MKSNVCKHLVLLLLLLLLANLGFSRSRDIIDTTQTKYNIYFRLSSYEIDPNYRDNNITLNSLKSDIVKYGKLERDKILSISLVGTSSVEGAIDANLILAHNRAKALKEYILNSNLWLNNNIVDLSYYVSGLNSVKAAINGYSNSSIRASANKILEQDISTTDKASQLKLLDGGKLWLYLSESVLWRNREVESIVVVLCSNEVSPCNKSDKTSLDKKSGEISLYNKSNTASLNSKSGESSLNSKSGESSLNSKSGEISLYNKSNTASLNSKSGESSLNSKSGEALPNNKFSNSSLNNNYSNYSQASKSGGASASVPSLILFGAADMESANNVNNSAAPLFALKTNLLFDVATLLNVELEVPIKERISLAAEWIFPWWVNDNGKENSKRNRTQLLNGNVDLKYWFGDRRERRVLTGWFAGLYFGGGIYDFERKGSGYQGEFFIATGLSGGYAHTIAKNLSLEYSLGVGFLKSNYRHYKACWGADDLWHPVRKSSATYTWIGPTKAKVSLVWLINHKARRRVQL